MFKNNHKSNIRPSFCLLFCIEAKKTTGYATDGGEDFVEIKSGEAGVTDDMKIEHDPIEDEMVTDAVAVKTVHELADMFIAHSVVDGMKFNACL